MRIAVFTECYHPIVNGVVVSVVTFSRELVKLGHQVDIYAPAFPGHRDTEPNVFRMPSISAPTHPRYPVALPWSSLALRHVIRSRRPDIIHAQHPMITGREARRWARHLGCPFVFTYHTLIREYAHYIPLPRPLVRAMAVRLSRTFSNSADCVVVPTRATGEILRSYGVRTRIEAIPTGVDFDLMRATARRPTRARLGIPESVPVIAFSGRIAREKSVEVLIQAFALLSRRFPEARLLLIGGGPWQEHCRDLAASLGIAERTVFTGYVPHEQVFDFLAESSVFAFASLTDPQGVVVPTRATGEILRSYGVRTRLEAIPTGVDLDLMRSTPRQPVRSRFTIPAGVPVIAFSGRIAREKSVDVLIQALQVVSERFPEARLLLIGGGPWQEHCQRLAASLGVAERTVFTGYLPRTEVFDCLAEADVFAFPSLTDTQGVVVLEAMALGCPPVAARSGAVEDVIEHEKNGLIVEPSPAGLAGGITRVLESEELRRALAGKARSRAEEFSSGRMAARLSQLYETLLKA